ncbi:hypothetical protein GCM10027589_05760 [Actinocorallia lasiicapitis]
MVVPPVVLYRPLRGTAYLLAWGRRPDSSWWALLFWVEVARDGGWRGSRAWVDAADVTPLPTQNYRNVPREPLPDHPRTGDRTDSRDPGHLTRAQDRARTQARFPTTPEPDF